MSFTANLTRLNHYYATHVSQFVDNDDISTHFTVNNYSAQVTIYIYGEDEVATERLRTVRKVIGTMEKKQSAYTGLYLKQENKYDDDSRLEVTLYPAPGTCEKVKVGTKTVTKPDPTVTVPTVTVEEDVYEWECKGIN